MGVPHDIDRFDIQRVAEVLADPARLRALERLQLLDTSSDERFDRITRLAARLLSTQVCLISLIDEDRQFFKSAVGTQQGTGTPMSHSFCKYSVASREPLQIADAQLHPVLKDNGATIELGVRAYLGVPLITSQGEAIGTLCALEMAPREWTQQDRAVLEDLAASVIAEAELLACARDLEFAHDRISHRSTVMEQLLDDLRELRHRERQRLASEVHDQSLQDVIAALMVARTIQDTGVAPEELCMVERCLTSAITSLRGTIDGLAPLQLPHASIDRFLVEAVGEIGWCFDLSVTTEIELGSRPLRSDTKLLVHRCLIELVRNACRHSGSSSVRVEAVVRAGMIHLSVADGGKGWSGSPPPGAGLNLLTEDLHMAGGSIASTTSPTGFAVTVIIPAGTASVEHEMPLGDDVMAGAA